MRENLFKANYKKKLKAIPESDWVNHRADSVRGIPDVYGHVSGKAVFLEFKKNRSEAKRQSGRTLLQRYRLERYRRNGALAYFVYPENAKAVLDAINALSLGDKILLAKINTDLDLSLHWGDGHLDVSKMALTDIED